MLVLIAGISLALLPDSYRSKLGELIGFSNTSSEIDLSGVVTETVKKGLFRVSVTENGELDSMSNASLTSNVRGTTTIIFIVPEGTYVKKGDIVCELDSSSLVDKERQQQITLTKAEADLSKSEENVEIQTIQNKSDISKANLNLDLADLDLEKYIKGDYILEKNEMNSKITIAQEKLTQATENYEFAKRVAKKGYKTLAEVERLRITVNDTRLQLEIAKEKLKVMVKYTHDRTIKELEENAKEAGRELDRVKRAGISSLTQFVADLKSRKLTFEVEESELAKMREQILACKLKAPQDGEVVYARQSRRRSDVQAIEAGTSVRERQAIINIPDLTKMKVDAHIHESRISMLKKGLPVLIRIDASPNEVFSGVVDSISSVPTSANWFQPNLKEYDSVIRLTDTAEKLKLLRPGLNAEVEIIVSERENVLQVPVQTIIGIGDKHYVYVVGESEIKRREVVVGISNNKQVEIIDGLEENLVVVMNPRTTFANEISELEKKFFTKQQAGTSKKISSKSNSISKSSSQSRIKKKGNNNPGHSKNGNMNKSPKKERNNGSKGQGKSGKRDPAAMFKRMDADGNGVLSGSEIPAQMNAFKSTLDKNGDGNIDQSEWNEVAKKWRAK
jgi:HlyD family secretion protein